jgi:dATP/dGTP diphosphohydrolase
MGPQVTLPKDNKARKALPIFDGVLMYFPDAIAAVAEVSRIGNEQHNPGEPLHWARGKSMDQMNTAVRHLMDHGTGTRHDSDGARHLAKAAWRVLAALQLDIEAERKAASQQSNQN